MLTDDTKITVFQPEENHPLKVPFVSSGIKAGFPSPAADFDGTKISLDALVVKHKEATFYAKASGNSMIGAGINDGDILVIDRSLEPTHNKIAVCFIDGEFTLKRIKIETKQCWLLAENEDYKPIKITEENDFIIWGIITFSIKSF